MSDDAIKRIEQDMGNDRYVLDASGEPVNEPDLLKWACWFEENSRVLRQTLMRDGKIVRESNSSPVRRDDPQPGDEDCILVSTVFLALDHGMHFGSDKGKPVLWETMVFMPDKDHEMNCEEERYMSKKEAQEGHERMIQRVLALKL